LVPLLSVLIAKPCAGQANLSILGSIRTLESLSVAQGKTCGCKIGEKGGLWKNSIAPRPTEILDRFAGVSLDPEFPRSDSDDTVAVIGRHVRQ
jgi:hypothetical protein